MSAPTSPVRAEQRPRTRKSIAHLPTGVMEPSMSENKENMTMDVASSALMAATKETLASSRRSRSKSVGPGGLNALNQDSSIGNAHKIAAMPRSILKPAIPLSPLREIPSRKSTSPGFKARPAGTSPNRPTTPKSAQGGSPPKKSPTKIGISPKVDSPSAARRQEREQIQKQREARRKSMANRRVSFAPEATLHTWTEPAHFQDPTSTGTSHGAQSSPSTPDGQGEESASQKRRKRRSSGLQPMVNDAEEALSSSPFNGSQADSGDETITTPQKDNESGDTESESGSDDGDSDSDASGSTMSMAEDDTQNGEREATLERNMDSGARAGNFTDKGMPDGDGEASMEIVNDEITSAFRPWAQRWEEMLNSGAVPAEPTTARVSQAQQLESENIGSPARSEIDDGEDMSMDMTKAVGRILDAKSKRVSSANTNTKVSSRRQSTLKRQSVTDETRDVGGNTMDFTTAVGGIRSVAAASSPRQEEEEMSMEFTTALGRIKENINALDSDGDMEMTDDVGRLLEADNTAPMELTVAVGGIKSRSPVEPTPKANVSVMTSATGSPSLSAPRSRPQSNGPKIRASQERSIEPGTPSQRLTPQPEKPTSPNRTTPNRNIALRSPSPKVLFQKELQAQTRSPVPAIDPQLFEANALNGQLTPRIVLAPKLSAKRRLSGIGMDKEGLGSPRVAALLDRRASIGDNADAFVFTQAGTRGVRFDDPKKLEAEVTRQREEDQRRESGRVILEREDEHTQNDLTGNLRDMISSMSPQKNKAHGRKSLAVGSARGLLGKRPAELDEDDDGEDDDGTPRGLRGRQASPVKKIRLQGPPPAADTTGRRSRHTLGVVSSNEKFLTPGSANLSEQKPASTPSHHSKYANVSKPDLPMPVLPSDGRPLDPNRITAGVSNDNVSLQEFLNMTNIRFMELNTTKRRHTIAPSSAQKGSTGRNADENDDQDPAKQMEDAVASGASTIPMLELFQHSCRELKKYISEGRHMVKHIETDVHQENPLLFREYISAAPKEKHVMDNQFKNMKTHARILSKGMWYEWRMKLLDSLKEGLESTSQGFRADDNSLKSQEAILEALPSMLELRDGLTQEAEILQSQAEELANCDQEELSQARNHLVALERKIAEKKTILSNRQKQMEEMNEAVELANEAKSECQQAIREAQRVREECRGWSVTEVAQVKDTVEALESKHDWHVNSSSGSMITMTFASALELTFNLAAYLPLSQGLQSGAVSASLSLSYVGDQPSHKNRKPQPLTTTKRFFLQLMRANLHALVPFSTSASQVLKSISNSWNIARAMEASVRNLELVARVPVIEIRGDDRLGVKAELFLREARTKLEMDFAIGVSARENTVSVRVTPTVKVLYGSAGRGREVKMASWLKDRVAEGAAWGMLAEEVKGRLEGKGKTLVR